jgi:addiction module HigA family antidote
VHPGEILSEDLMTPLGLSINGLARDLRVPVTRVSQIVSGRRSVTADTALRLARYFAMTPYFWMNLQAVYDLDVVTRLISLDLRTCAGPLFAEDRKRLPGVTKRPEVVLPPPCGVLQTGRRPGLVNR